MSKLADFIKDHRVTEVECLVPDLSGIARGKILPAEKFLRILRERGLRMPEAIFIQTVTGDYPDDEDVTSPANSDIYMIPDEDTIRIVPWYTDKTAQVINDCVYADGHPVDLSPRWVLRRVLELYAEKGWRPVIAPGKTSCTAVGDRPSWRMRWICPSKRWRGDWRRLAISSFPNEKRGRGRCSTTRCSPTGMVS